MRRGRGLWPRPDGHDQHRVHAQALPEAVLQLLAQPRQPGAPQAFERYARIRHHDKKRNARQFWYPAPGLTFVKVAFPHDVFYLPFMFFIFVFYKCQCFVIVFFGNGIKLLNSNAFYFFFVIYL